MRSRNPGPIIGVSVGTRQGPRLSQGHSRVPGRLESLRSRFFGGEDSEEGPSIVDILMSATMISGMRASKAFEADADLMIFPKVRDFEQLDFSALDGLQEAGYAAAKEALEGWITP